MSSEDVFIKPADAVPMVFLGTDSIEAQERSISQLAEALEIQQRWIQIVGNRAAVLASASRHETEQDQKVEAELVKLEAGLGAMSKMSIEIAEKWKLSEEELIAERHKSIQSREVLQRELEEIQEDRIRGEVESVRRAKELEETFERIVAEKEAELSSLRAMHLEQLRESDDLRRQLEEEKMMKPRRTSKEKSDIQVKSNEDPLLLDALNALWQITSDSSLISSTLQGAPNLLPQLFKTIEAVMDGNGSSSLLALSTATLSPSTQDTSLSAYGLQHLAPICGLLVNVAATSEGRRRIMETRSGELLVVLLQLLAWLPSCNTVVPHVDHHQSRTSISGFDGNAIFAMPGRKDPPKGSREHKNSATELLLCILSNLCAEREVAVQLMSAGLVESLALFIQAEKSDPLRRYAVRMVRSIIEFIPWVPSSTTSQQKHGSSKDQVEQESAFGVGACFKQTGDFITILSKDTNLRMLGLELLSALQAVMPMEE